MGMRFRRSIKLGPGVRFNLSKTGIGNPGPSQGCPLLGALRDAIRHRGAFLLGMASHDMKQTGGDGNKASASTKAAPAQQEHDTRHARSSAPAHQSKVRRGGEALPGPREPRGSLAPVH